MKPVFTSEEVATTDSVFAAFPPRRRVGKRLRGRGFVGAQLGVGELPLARSSRAAAHHDESAVASAVFDVERAASRGANIRSRKLRAAANTPGPRCHRGSRKNPSTLERSKPSKYSALGKGRAPSHSAPPSSNEARGSTCTVMSAKDRFSVCSPSGPVSQSRNSNIAAGATSKRVHDTCSGRGVVVEGLEALLGCRHTRPCVRLSPAPPNSDNAERKARSSSTIFDPRPRVSNRVWGG